MEEVQEGSSSKIECMIDTSDSLVMGGKPEDKHTKSDGDDSASD